MEPFIDLAPGAEDNPLANRLVTRIRESIETDPARLKSFLALKSTILVVPFDTGDALTLRFDLGRLAVHEGNIGIPSVTLGLPSADLSELAELRLPRVSDLERFVPGRRGLRDGEGNGNKRSLRSTARLFASGTVKIYGAWAHPRTVMRILRLLSPLSRSAV